MSVSDGQLRTASDVSVHTQRRTNGIHTVNETTDIPDSSMCIRIDPHALTSFLPFSLSVPSPLRLQLHHKTISLRLIQLLDQSQTVICWCLSIKRIIKMNSPGSCAIANLGDMHFLYIIEHIDDRYSLARWRSKFQTYVKSVIAFDDFRQLLHEVS